MNTNCLITKVKGAVDNDNIPFINKAFLSCEKLSGSVNSASITIMCSEPSVMKTKIPVQYGSDAPATTFNLRENQVYYFSFSLADQGSGIDDLVEINNIYSVKAFGITNTGTLRPCIAKQSNQKGSVDRILKYANPIAVGISIHDIANVPDSAGFVTVKCDGYPEIYNIDHLLDLPNIDILCLYGRAGISARFTLDHDISSSPITCLFGEPVGDLLYLPTNVKILGIQGVTSYDRSIEDIVAKMRSNGRTSGAINMIGAKNCNILYKGTTIRSQYGTETVPAANVTYGMAYLTWTANSIQFVADAPAELENYTSIPAMSAWISSQT